MSPHLQSILDKIQNADLPEADKEFYIKSIKEIDKNENLVQFKLERSEKDRYTLSVMLEESIEDLQKKTRAIEAQNRELEIEAALEKVRSCSLGMHNSEELQEVVHTVFEKLKELNVDFYTVIIVIFQEDSKDIFWWLKNIENQQYARILLRYSDIRYLRDLFEARNNGSELMSKFYPFEEKNELFQYLFERTDFKHVPQPQKRFLLESEFATMSVAMAKNTGIHITSYSRKSFSETENEILKRFAKVFDQAYTRFLDLQKAETQAREAQIQLALERVRARTMAMQKSDELAETANVLFQQFKELGESPGQISIGIVNESEKVMEMWVSMMENPRNPMYKSPLDEPHVLQRIYRAWKEQIKSLVIDLSGNDLKEYMAFRKAQHGIVAKEDLAYHRRVIGVAIFSRGIITLASHEPIPSATVELLERFAAVFDLTYTRFLDLKNAETQAREAQIEAALERVRSKAMAMHKTEDFNPAVAVVFEELEKLDLGVLRCGISVLDKETRTGDIWVTSTTDQGSAVQVSGDESFDIHPLLQGAFDAWLRQEDFYYVLEGEDLTNYYKAVKAAHFELPQSQFVSSEGEDRKQYAYVAVYHAGGLFAFRDAEFPDEAKKVMKRFAGVFDLTYKRFLDLQKAEAQAREAQIEASLERVRTKAMAMHKSEDLHSAVAAVFEELDKLNLGLMRCGIAILDKERPRGDIWITIKSASGKAIQVAGDEPMEIHPLLYSAYKGWLEQEDRSYVLQGEDLVNYYRALGKTNFQDAISTSFNKEGNVQQQFHFNAVFQHGSIFAFLNKAFTDEAKLVMKRFANVFNLTYKRFLDLQQAEAQAREATIEAALERVRGKAMAMHNSNDLSVTASMVFTELRKLGVNPIRCGVGLLTKESRKAQLYSATSAPDGDSLALVGWVMLSGHPVLEQIYDKWMSNEDCYPELAGEQLRSYYELLLAGLSVPFPDWQSGQKQYGHFFSFSIGCLYAWSDTPYNDAEIKILKRFATIIDLTFRRYMELQQSEANARETVKQAALDRIRADIASMRTTADLDRITPLIWNELTILGIPFIRCGVFIMDEDQKLTHTFLSTPDGKAIAAFHLPFDSPGNVSQVLTHWRQKKNYLDHWDELAFTEFANTLVKQGAMPSSEQYLETVPPGGFYLHFIPFLQGMLYVGNTTQLGEEEIKLIQAVADAFSTAYARYEDFNKLEAAKQQIEMTLVDLKQTQQQLVQSEKMASLGELTAGIAHEIQNPLNFVNNFSEVSNELLDEMKAELATGNRELASQIAEDVKQNLDKILLHGKRADAIVKGMLQHSRTSSGQKELTDINALADEYLRLAYHGLRAKDKTFNAKFETNLDETIDRISVVPQEIGRVILNLINNAFYAVTEKKKRLNGTYEPTVSVTTRKLNGKVEIIVKDNGSGIPQRILDKVFQPFFTTKPTGQGTGLGLSLSYDIITKGHGGELKVTTVENTGSEFIITLPT